MDTAFGHDEDFFVFVTFPQLSRSQSSKMRQIWAFVVGRHLFSLKTILVSVFNVGNQRTQADDIAHMIWHEWKEKNQWLNNLIFVASSF